MDDQFIPWNQASCHVATHTLHYGSGVFEGIRSYNKKMFKSREHFKRFHASAGILDFEIPYSADTLVQACDDLLIKNNLDDAYIRPIAWHGDKYIGVESYPNPIHVAIIAIPFDPHLSTKNGLKLMWSQWVRPAPSMSPVHAKASGQYVTGSLSKNKALQSGYDEALMLDYRGYVAECSSANIFMVKGGVVSTPIADCFLRGITRQTVIEIVQSHSLPFIERHILPCDLMSADEIFITATATGIQPIIQIGDTAFSKGPITNFIQNAYGEITKR